MGTHLQGGMSPYVLSLPAACQPRFGGNRPMFHPWISGRLGTSMFLDPQNSPVFTGQHGLRSNVASIIAKFVT